MKMLNAEYFTRMYSDALKMQSYLYEWLHKSWHLAKLCATDQHNSTVALFLSFLLRLLTWRKCENATAFFRIFLKLHQSVSRYKVYAQQQITSDLFGSRTKPQQLGRGMHSSTTLEVSHQSQSHRGWRIWTHGSPSQPSYAPDKCRGDNFPTNSVGSYSPSTVLMPFPFFPSLTSLHLIFQKI